MKTALRFLLALVILAVVVSLALIWVPVQRTPPSETLAADWKPEPGRGAYVMRAADCAACHTADGGTPLAGGRAIASPMGAIWSSNITPDKASGIGNWTLDQFRAALVDGLDDHGKHLYPAMPYENYRYMSESDIRALYDHLMHEVKPVNSTVKATQLSFPFNLRFGIRAWNWLALRGEPTFKPASTNALQQRGQYLVEGPGHCAACHSPRTAFMTQDGTRTGDANYLTGGVLAGWSAPALHGSGTPIANWTTSELAAYLATGRNAHSAANGEMALAVEHSLAYLTDNDLNAIAVYLKALDGKLASEVPSKVAATGPRAIPAAKADAAGEATAKLLSAANPDMALGPRLYLDNCAACHFVTGKGAPEIFPELQANALVTAADPSPLIGVILNGASLPSTERRPARLAMQGYADRLSNEEVAELASFVRSAWGNQAKPVTALQVSKLRTAAKH